MKNKIVYMLLAVSLILNVINFTYSFVNKQSTDKHLDALTTVLIGPYINNVEGK